MVVADVAADAARADRGRRSRQTDTRRRAPASTFGPLESATAMARAAVDAFGGIDILINNAAIMTDLPPYGLGNMPVDQWDRVDRT